VPSVVELLPASEGRLCCVYLGDDGVDEVEGRVVVWEFKDQIKMLNLWRDQRTV